MRNVHRCCTAISMSVLLCASMHAEEISVAQGDTANYNDATSHSIAALDVHGTLNVTGTSKSAITELAFATATTSAYLGTNTGDNAVINIGDYGRIAGGCFVFGGPSGVGGFTIGGKRKDDATSITWNGAKAHLAIAKMVIPEDATSDSGVIDILTLNDGACAGMKQTKGLDQRVVNRSPYVDARILFNGGSFCLFNAYSTTYLFLTEYETNKKDVPEGMGGNSIILESVDGNPIWIRLCNGSPLYAAYGNAEFRGAGDVVLEASGQDNPGWIVNSNVTWCQTGDLKLTGSFTLQCNSASCLPKATTNGIVQVLGNSSCVLDMKGCNQSVNGLVVSGSAMLTNSSVKATTLTIGAGKPDGVFSVQKFGTNGTITVCKSGAGVMTVTNTPAFPPMEVAAGTVHFKDDDCSLGTLWTYADATVIVDSCTLNVGALTDDGAVFLCKNGGQLAVTYDQSEDAKVYLGDVAAIDGLSLCKAGDGELNVHQDAVFSATNIHVSAGTLSFSSLGTTNQWLRFTFNKMYKTRKFPSSQDYMRFELSEILLTDASSGRVDGAGTTKLLDDNTYGSAIANAAADCEAKDMAAGSVWASDQDWTMDETQGYKSRSPSAFFDGQNWTRVAYTNTTDVSEENPKIFIVRLPSVTNTYQYIFKNGYSSYYHPSDWKVESSPDGITWTECDSRSSVVPPSSHNTYYNDGEPYLILDGLYGAAGFQSTANVQVDRGATLDCSRVTGGQTISTLTVDCSDGTGDGTFVNMSFAEEGSLYLVNVSDKNNLKSLPAVFTDAAMSSNLSSWTVYIDGVQSSRRVALWSGRLTIVPLGLSIIVR